ncbi:hypothetical protein [Umezawaea tangerina]|nr:hypothetical protein [Umezawaea tangerina]
MSIPPPAERGRLGGGVLLDVEATGGPASPTATAGSTAAGRPEEGSVFGSGSPAAVSARVGEVRPTRLFSDSPCRPRRLLPDARRVARAGR